MTHTMAEWNLDNERNRAPKELNRVSCHRAEVEVHKQRNLCRVKGRYGGYGGYRKDILKVKLTERDALLVCENCEGIMREVCLSNRGEQFCNGCEFTKPPSPMPISEKHSNTHQTLCLGSVSNRTQTYPLGKWLIHSSAPVP